MANVNFPNGATPIGHLYGAPHNGGVRKYVCPASDGTALYMGQFVKLGGSLSADENGDLRPTAIAAAAGDALLLGVVVGFERLITDTSVLHRAASTLRSVYVADDPYTIFEIQEDSVGAALTADECGENADIVVGSGSTVTGRAASMLDSSDHKTGTAQLRILDIARPISRSNAIGDYCRWRVLINEHVFKSTTGV